jgi:hypothetical protein
LSFEDDLSRQLHGRAAAVRVTADVDDLQYRIRNRAHRVQRRERLALSAAVVVLAASVGGLAGALVRVPHAGSKDASDSGYLNGSSKPAPKHATAPAVQSRLSAPAPITVVNTALPGGLHVAATLQPLTRPLAITFQWNSSVECSKASILTTTVGQDGQFGGATAITSLPALSPSGLEILSSGILQVPGGGQVWWATVSVGTAVARVAAESIGGTPVAATPSRGVAVLAGPMSTSSNSAGDMSAVVEAADGQSLQSLAFVLGQDPIVVGEAATRQVAGCSTASLPSAPDSATASQPADPQLDAGAIVASFEQAFSANTLLGFSANLAAVAGGETLTAPPATSTRTTKTSASSDISSDAPKMSPATGAQASATSAEDGAGLGIQQVSFTSARSATVVYTIGTVSFTGLATLGADGIWRVAKETFCAAALAGLVQTVVPPNFIGACDG